MKIGQGRIASANYAKRESAKVITREPHSQSRIKTIRKARVETSRIERGCCEVSMDNNTF